MTAGHYFTFAARQIFHHAYFDGRFDRLFLRIFVTKMRLVALTIRVMGMVKLRDARYCNLKLLLIFLVIYGHLIEPQIANSRLLMVQYKGIYLFHMPLFCFLSGLFLKDGKACAHQFKKALPLYLLFQGVAVCFGAKPLIPYWHLWYLLSYSLWLGFGWFWFRFFGRKGKIIILFVSVLIGCLAGLCPYIGRTLSLSRTLVFLPYFWMGLICKPSFPWERLRAFSFIAFVAVIALSALWIDQIPVEFLYQATPYSELDSGVILRLLCYLLGALLCIVLLALIPSRRFPFTKLGADTLPAYLIHAPIVSNIRKLDIPWFCHLPIAGAILYGTYKLLQWHSGLYGIVPTERRGSRCLPFKRSTKHMPSPSIDSC